MKVEIGGITLEEKGKGFLDNGLYVILFSFSNNNKRHLQVVYDGETFSYVDIQGKESYPMVLPKEVKQEVENYVLEQLNNK